MTVAMMNSDFRADFSTHRSLSAKEPLIIGFFCGNWCHDIRTIHCCSEKSALKSFTFENRIMTVFRVVDD